MYGIKHAATRDGPGMVAKRLMVLLGSRQRSARDRCGRLAAVSLCQPIVKRIL